MPYSLATLWHERQRFLPGVLAVAFSALLIALQTGLLIGLFSITSIPVDRTRADIWVGSPQVLSVDLGRPIPESFVARLQIQPEVERTEIYLQGFAYWTKPGGGSELCMVIGSSLEDDALGLLSDLRERPALRKLLTEPGAIVIDESEFGRLGVSKVGDMAKIADYNVRVVGTIRGVKSLAGPYVFCSRETARPFLHLRPDQTTYVLASSRNPDAVVERLNRAYDGEMLAFTKDQFSSRTQMHWLIKTKAGFALFLAAGLGLLVGAVVTSQTLYAATAAAMREYAVLRALGIPRWRMAASVVAQSFWVGLLGIVLAIPVAFVLSQGAEMLHVPVPLPLKLIATAATLTLAVALLSGLAALRSLRLVEPASLLR